VHTRASVRSHSQALADLCVSFLSAKGSRIAEFVAKRAFQPKIWLTTFHRNGSQCRPFKNFIVGWAQGVEFDEDESERRASKAARVRAERLASGAAASGAPSAVDIKAQLAHGLSEGVLPLSHPGRAPVRPPQPPVTRPLPPVPAFDAFDDLRVDLEKHQLEQYTETVVAKKKTLADLPAGHQIFTGPAPSQKSLLVAFTSPIIEALHRIDLRLRWSNTLPAPLLLIKQLPALSSDLESLKKFEFFLNAGEAETKRESRISQLAERGENLVKRMHQRMSWLWKLVALETQVRIVDSPRCHDPKERHLH
jgi:hypothetical protein